MAEVLHDHGNGVVLGQRCDVSPLPVIPPYLGEKQVGIARDEAAGTGSDEAVGFGRTQCGEIGENSPKDGGTGAVGNTVGDASARLQDRRWTPLTHEVPPGGS